MSYMIKEKVPVVHERSWSSINKKIRFLDDFPEVKDILVEVKEKGFGELGSERSYVYHLDNIPNFGEHIECGNPSCYDGGIAIGSMIREMIANRRMKLEKVVKCQGYEGMSRAYGKYHDCDCLYLYKVSIYLIYRSS